VSTSMTINATAIILLALYIAVAKRQGIDSRRLSGTIQNDILKEYIARGTYIFPPKASLRIVTDIFAFCAREVPQWNTISISGYHIREAGSTAVQEVAFTFANALTYVQAAVDAGLDVNAFGQRLSFFFNAHNDFLEEVAKFRAARRLWARLMRDRFGATNPRAMQLRFHTQTAGSTLTPRQPDNNIVRVAIQALSAVMGGTQSLHTNSRDEALALPTEESARIALRTQQIIAEESGVANTIDPFAGSYHIEKLTNEIDAGATQLLARIDAVGGTLSAIESGYIQRQIQDSAYQAQIAIDAGDAIVVGVNRYMSDEIGRIEMFSLDPTLERAQADRVGDVRVRRDQPRWRSALDAIIVAAKASDNLVPPIVAAVEAQATVGEIADALRGVFGEYKEVALD
jgi:methylmalonyl-CoA mutase N-terminal domain/subunit